LGRPLVKPSRKISAAACGRGPQWNNSFPDSLNARINQGIELDKIVPVLNDLMLYEYSNIKQPKEDKLSKFTVTDIGQICLFDFGVKTNELAEVKIEEKTSFKKVITKFVSKVLSKIKSLLISENLATCFFSWLIFLFIILTILNMLLNIGSVAVVSTAFIVSAMFAVANSRKPR
jgi:hypothetical protein